MKYPKWRDEVFGQPEGVNLIDVELSAELFRCPANQMLDHIDCSLVDDTLHHDFSRTQIGVGLNLIYRSVCSGIVYSYLAAEVSDKRRGDAVANIKTLYQNFFKRYCPPLVNDIGGEECLADKINYLCFMFWDVFVLCPENTSTKIEKEMLSLMQCCLESENESVITSTIHGLGHWNSGTRRARAVLNAWLTSPSSNNPRILRYAEKAVAGNIL